jgi:hypothetical protein
MTSPLFLGHPWPGYAPPDGGALFAYQPRRLLPPSEISVPSLPLFPSTLPNPMPDGYSEVDQDDNWRFQPAAGPEMIGARGTAGGALINCAFELTIAQREILLNFFRVTCRRGSIRFQWNDPVTRILYKWQWKGPPRLGMQGPVRAIVTISLLRLN